MFVQCFLPGGEGVGNLGRFDHVRKCDFLQEKFLQTEAYQNVFTLKHETGEIEREDCRWY